MLGIKALISSGQDFLTVCSGHSVVEKESNVIRSNEWKHSAANERVCYALWLAGGYQIN